LTDGLLPVGILPRVAKILWHFATITDGHTDRMLLIGILLRVAKQLRPLPLSPTDIPTHYRWMMHIQTRMTVRLPGQSAQLPMDLPMDKANPMCACSDKQLLTVLQTDIKKSGGIFKILVRISKQYRRKYQRDLMPPP